MAGGVWRCGRGGRAVMAGGERDRVVEAGAP
jgi:hypothetical protein